MSSMDCIAEGKRILKEAKKTGDSSLYLKASYYFAAAKDREATAKCIQELIKGLGKKLKKEHSVSLEDEIRIWKKLLENIKRETHFIAFCWLMFERSEHITDEDLEKKQTGHKSKEFQDVIVGGDAESFMVYVEEHPEEVLKARRMLRK